MKKKGNYLTRAKKKHTTIMCEKNYFMKKNATKNGYVRVSVMIGIL